MKLALVLILLHGPDGHEIRVNPTEIVSLRSAAAESNLVHDNVKCFINMADGKFINASETCEEIQRLLEGVKK
jgi:hypothetical protein